MIIYSEKTNAQYDTVEECERAEKEFDEKKAAEAERKAKLTETRKERAKEVEEAFKTAYDLMHKFTKDYGSFHFTINSDDINPLSLLDFFF